MSKTKSQTLEDSWKDFLTWWRRLEKEAYETKDYSFYKEFLGMVQGEFSKLYAEITEPFKIELIEEVLKFASCKIRENMIKYKEQKKDFL